VSRLLGGDPSLVLHGGGNTSIKSEVPDPTGEVVSVVYVKGSGWNLGTIEEAGFTALRRDRLLRLLTLESLSDALMVNELRQARLDSTAPDPSIEALLHARIPYRVVLHSHADAIVALSDQPDEGANVQRALAGRVLVVPYVKPGFDLARTIAKIMPPELDGILGIVLAHHGLFTFGDTAQEAYDCHISLVAQAEDYLGMTSRGLPVVPIARQPGEAIEIAQLREEASTAAGFPLIARQSSSARAIEFIASADLDTKAAQGPATPEHVIRTKRLPMIGRDVQGYATAYRAYFEHGSKRITTPITALDPAPRVVLDQTLGLVVLGDTAAAANINEDIYLHTMDIIDAAQRQSGYATLSADEFFDIEYWELEQVKLRNKTASKRFLGEVALVTGAASGIGRACAAALLKQGACVIGLDLNPDVTATFDSDQWLGVVADVSSADDLRVSIDQGVRRFGGLDILVPGAGVFAATTPIADMTDDVWLKSLNVNLNGVERLFSQCHPYLKLSPRGGRVVLVASKNVGAPGPGAAAYSVSKAAALQLARVAAIEWAPDGIRVNAVSPDAVFDTGIWTPELLAERARRYGLTVTEYKRRNLLKLEILSKDVAAAVADLCSVNFRATTGSNVPVDGGNERII
jgi:rhamnose utilization protein RhaD (predicted bifunctional aldolase and dehydrogenase)/NAD(P)-dependent dehydrogenase (short-subunit alcohol dehydrogenase family)